MKTEFTIDKGKQMMPIRHQNQKYPFGEMDVGDSFYSDHKRAVAAAHVWSRTHKPKLFATRAEGKGARIWRTI